MSKLSRDDVLKLAALSRLKLTDEEVEKFCLELAAILDYVKQLDGADTKGLEPTYQLTGLKNVTRQDEVHNYGYKTKDLLKNAPVLRGGQLKVKRVID